MLMPCALTAQVLSFRNPALVPGGSAAPSSALNSPGLAQGGASPGMQAMGARLPSAGSLPSAPGSMGAPGQAPQPHEQMHQQQQQLQQPGPMSQLLLGPLAGDVSSALAGASQVRAFPHLFGSFPLPLTCTALHVSPSTVVLCFEWP